MYQKNCSMDSNVYLLILALVNLANVNAQFQNFKTPFSCTLSCGETTYSSNARNDGYKVKKSLVGEQGCPQFAYSFRRRNQKKDCIRVKSPIPELKELSACTRLDTDKSKSFPIVSYATDSFVNDFLVYGEIREDGILTMFMNFHDEELIQNVTYEIRRNIHLCFTLDSHTGAGQLYIDGERTNKFLFRKRVPLKGGGAYVIGQEQDTLMGGFVRYQSYAGTITNHMLWGRVLMVSEINSMYESRCYCARDFILALKPELIQLDGAVTAIPISKCDE